MTVAVPVVDVIIAAATLAAAVWGYRRGVMTNALPAAGFVAGALLGSRVAPHALGRVLPSPYAPMLAVAVALLCGVLLAAASKRAGFELGRRVTGHAKLSAAVGALAAVPIALLAIWIVSGVAARVAVVGDAFGDSEIVAGLNAIVPPPGPLVEAVSFEREDIGPGAPPRVDVTRDPEVRAAKESVAKIVASTCGSGRQGSGWIAADGIVATNAHVVAASDAISVQMEGTGELHPAQAVAFDPRNDIAILRAPGLRGERPLPIETKATPGSQLAMLGFPGGGPYTAKSARLGTSAIVPVMGGEGPHVTREAQRLIAPSRPGNSGGPVVNLDGGVVGVVYAGNGRDDSVLCRPLPSKMRSGARSGL